MSVHVVRFFICIKENTRGADCVRLLLCLAPVVCCRLRVAGESSLALLLALVYTLLLLAQTLCVFLVFILWFTSLRHTLACFPLPLRMRVCRCCCSCD